MNPVALGNYCSNRDPIRCQAYCCLLPFERVLFFARFLKIVKESSITIILVLRTQLRLFFLKKQLYLHSKRPYWLPDTFLDRKIKFQNFLKISIFILCLCVKVDSRWPYNLLRATTTFFQGRNRKKGRHLTIRKGLF